MVETMQVDSSSPAMAKAEQPSLGSNEAVNPSPSEKPEIIVAANNESEQQSSTADSGKSTRSHAEPKSGSPSTDPLLIDGNSGTTLNPSTPKPQKLTVDERLIDVLNRLELDDDAQSASDKGMYLTIKLNKSEDYTVPWRCCSSWERLRAFLTDVYEGDEEKLQALAEDNIFIQTGYRTRILPKVYSQVIKSERSLDITLPFKSADSDTDESGDKSATTYENRVDYSIGYYEDLGYGSPTYLWSISSERPAHFEIFEEAQGTLPVLEQKQKVVCKVASVPLKKPEGELANQKLRLRVSDNVESSYLQIHSHYLLNVLRSVIGYSSTMAEGGSDALHEGAFAYPYMDIFWYIKDISAYKTDVSGLRKRHSPEYNELADAHIDILFRFLVKSGTLPIEQLDALWAQATPTTTFAGIQLLLRPGEDVYVEEHGKLNAFVVDSVVGGVTYNCNPGTGMTVEPYTVNVWNLSFDGKSIGRRPKTMTITYFDSEREITSLPVFPVRFQDEKDKGVLRNKLIKRGKDYFRYCKTPSFLEYNGPGLKPGWKNYERARVVVEHASQPWKSDTELPQNILPDEDDEIGLGFRLPQCECIECKNARTSSQVNTTVRFGDYKNIDATTTAELSDHKYLLLTSHMYAFILKDRTYDIVDVEHLSGPKMVKNAIERLVMEDTYKETIKAIVKAYTDRDTSAQRFSADFIQGKGEGQILLLHGPPGTGKTLTAESVAEFTKRPLLQITAADLGDEPEDVEKNLLRFFKNANDWDAVVLLDEADVYLEERSISDLKRNSIVSIFLRALDYFQGILFLTTNRVGRFDEAFMSRIHICIEYKRLNETARMQIWKNLFDKLKENAKQGGPKMVVDQEAKQYVRKNKDLQNLEWNGREIRNAFQTAVALAMYGVKKAKENDNSDDEAGENVVTVEEKHLEQVVTLSSAFKKYMKSTRHGFGESDYAYKHGMRNDEIGKGNKKPKDSIMPLDLSI